MISIIIIHIAKLRAVCSTTLKFSSILLSHNACITKCLKHSNAAAHSVESNVFYVVIHLPEQFKTTINLISLGRVKSWGVTKTKI